MNFTVRLFGTEALAAGRREIEVSLDDPVVSCENLRGAVLREVPAIAGTIDSCRFAVNSEFVGDQHKVDGDDEVALIGMVSGG